ncbi:hypothetical protein TNCV_4280201 [Trichonephila clavipes]|nr:hypothetical protein TNCV_4280201 [Trichonephila clavipes]
MILCYQFERVKQFIKSDEVFGRKTILKVKNTSENSQIRFQITLKHFQHSDRTISVIKVQVLQVDSCQQPLASKLVNTTEVKLTECRRCLLGIRTVIQSSIPCRDKTWMWGLAKVGFFILLSGMAVIGWSMESGRRGKRASSGWEMFKIFWHG